MMMILRSWDVLTQRTRVHEHRRLLRRGAFVSNTIPLVPVTDDQTHEFRREDGGCECVEAAVDVKEARNNRQ